jgi:hypothetical protein
MALVPYISFSLPPNQHLFWDPRNKVVGPWSWSVTPKVRKVYNRTSSHPYLHSKVLTHGTYSVLARNFTFSPLYTFTEQCLNSGTRVLSPYFLVKMSISTAVIHLIWMAMFFYKQGLCNDKTTWLCSWFFMIMWQSKYNKDDITYTFLTKILHLNISLIPTLTIQQAPCDFLTTTIILSGLKTKHYFHIYNL